MQRTVRQFVETYQSSMWACDVNGVIEAKPQKEADPGEYGRNNKVTLHGVAITLCIILLRYLEVQYCSVL